ARLALDNVQCDAVKTGGTIGVGIANAGLLEIAHAVSGTHRQPVFAGFGVPLVFPALPEQQRVVWLDFRLDPLSIVDLQFNLVDAARAGERDTTDQDDAAFVRGEVITGCVDFRDDIDDSIIAPTAFLPVALVVVIDNLDLLEPFDVLLAVDVWHIETTGISMFLWQGGAVHPVHQQGLSLQCLGNRDSIAVTASPLE